LYFKVFLFLSFIFPISAFTRINYRQEIVFFNTENRFVSIKPASGRKYASFEDASHITDYQLFMLIDGKSASFFPPFRMQFDAN